MSTWANKGDLGDAISADTNSISCALDSASGQISRLGEAIPDSLQGEAYDADRRLVNNVCVPALKAQYVALQSMYDGDQSNSGGVSDLPDDPSPLDSDDLSGKIKELDNSIAALQVTQSQDSGSKPSLMETLQKDNGISSGSSGSSSQGSSALDWQISSLQGTRDRLAEALQALMDYDSASSSYYSDADGAIADALSQSCRQMASVRETGEVPSDYPSWGAGLDDLYEKAFAKRAEDIRESLLNADGTYNDDKVRSLMNKGDSATSEEIVAAAMAYRDVATQYYQAVNNDDPSDDEEKKTAYEHFIADCYAYARTETIEDEPQDGYSWTVNVYAPSQVFTEAIGVLSGATTAYWEASNGQDGLSANDLPYGIRQILGLDSEGNGPTINMTMDILGLAESILANGEVKHIVGTFSVSFNYNSLLDTPPSSIPLDPAAVSISRESKRVSDPNFQGGYKDFNCTVLKIAFGGTGDGPIDWEDPTAWYNAPRVNSGELETKIEAYDSVDEAYGVIADDFSKIEIQDNVNNVISWLSMGMSVALDVVGLPTVNGESTTSTAEFSKVMKDQLERMRGVAEAINSSPNTIGGASEDGLGMVATQSDADALGITVHVAKIDGRSIVVDEYVNEEELRSNIRKYNERCRDQKGFREISEEDTEKIVAYVKRYGTNVGNSSDVPEYLKEELEAYLRIEHDARP